MWAVPVFPKMFQDWLRALVAVPRTTTSHRIWRILVTVRGIEDLRQLRDIGRPILGRDAAVGVEDALDDGRRHEAAAVGVGAERTAELQRRHHQLVALRDGFGAVLGPLGAAG